jgi:hypothetical protein
MGFTEMPTSRYIFEILKMNKGNKKSNFNIMKTPIGDSPEQSRLNLVH